MSEELLQRDLIKNPEKIGKWDYYNIGATSIKALKEYRIVRSIDYGKLEKKKVDGLIVQQKNVIAIVEFKKPKEFNTAAKKKKAIEQELDVAKALDAHILIATDTKESIWINVKTENRILDEDGKNVTYNFDPKDENIPKLINKIRASINHKNDQIKPKELVNPTDLAKQIWQDIWSVSGATPENCLYTFVELFIFKYLSDLSVLQGIYNFNTLYGSYNDNNEEEILEIYASTIRPKIKVLFPENPIDKTTIINGTIFVSKDQKAVKGYSTVFKKVLRKFKEYGKLEHIDYDFKSQLFESFLKESISKKNWGQFFTPLKVIRAINELVQDDIRPGIKICDPACGVGKFLLEPILKNIDDYYSIKNGKIIPNIEIRGFDKGFDKDEQKTIILAKANMLIYFSDLIKENPNITKEFSDLFNKSFILKTNSILGTLSDPSSEEYDLILTNPPYVTSGSSNLKEEIKKDGELIDYFKINGMGVEGLFMEWIVNALKPGGKAVIVVPDGIFNRQNDKNLRKFIKDKCYIDCIISLPTKTFFTTPKKTYILKITKKNKAEKQAKPVFTYLASEIGESRDVYRFDINEDDLVEAVKLYRAFSGSMEYFQENNTDPRCKVQPIDKFDPNEYWSVDRWWSEEEKIELGIIEQQELLNLNEFSVLINDVSETLSEYSNLVREVAQKKKINKSLQKVKLSNTEYFELSIGKRVLVRELNKITSGSIPVYSSNVKEIFGYHTSSIIENFSNDFVLWGIDGDFEFNSIKKENPFRPTDHCGVIRIWNENILPEYLMIQLYIVKSKYGFDRGLRASIRNMKPVEISLPFNDSGEIDIKYQSEVIQKFNSIKEVLNKVEFYNSKFKEVKVDILSSSDKVITKKLTNIFDDNQGNAYYTKKRVLGNNWHGSIPVYSSNTKENGLLMKMDINKVKPSDLYHQRCLTWTIDGVGAGKIFVRNEDNMKNEKRDEYYFTFNNHCGILIPKSGDIDMEYMKHILQPIFYEKVKGYDNKKLGSNQIKELDIPIPIKDNGDFDIEEQKRIASIFRNIEKIRSSLIEELDKLLKINVDY